MKEHLKKSIELDQQEDEELEMNLEIQFQNH